MAFNAGAIEATLTINRNPFNAGLAAARKDAERFANDRHDAQIGLKLDKAAAQKIKSELAALSKNMVIDVKTKLDNTSLQAVRTRLNSVVGRATVRATLDNASLQAIRQRINQAVGSIRVRATLDSATLSAVRQRINQSVGTITVRARLDGDSLAAIRERINRSVGYINVRLRIAAGELQAIRARLEATRASINVNVNYDRSQLASMMSQFSGFTRQAAQAGQAATHFGSSASGAFRHADGAMRIFIGGMPLILPMLASAVVGAVGLIGGLTSIIGTASMGFLAFGGVAAGVFSKIKDIAKDSAANVKAGATAYKAVETATRALGKTVSDVAKDNERAQRQVENAERSRTQSVKQLQRAQQDLTDAIRDAREEMEDLALSLRGASLDEEEAILRLARAKKELDEARAAGITGDDLKQLEIDVKRAALGIDLAKEKYGDLKEESDAFAKSGVMGSRQVRDATDRVTDAAQGVRDADREVAEARANQTAVHQEGLARIAEANARVAEAQAEYAKSSVSHGEAISAAMMVAANALDRVKKGYDDLVKRTEVPVSNAMASLFDAATKALSTLDPLVVAAAGAFERAGETMEAFFGSPRWKQFVDFLAANVGPNLDAIFRIMGLGAIVVMNLVEAFDPLADWMLNAMVQGMQDLAKWTGELKDNPEFQQFLKRVMEAAPAVLEFFGKLIRFFFELAVALEPIGTKILDVFNQVFDGISKIDPEVLQGIGIAIAVIMSALMLGASPQVAIVVGIIAGLATGFDNLYKSSKPLQDVIARIAGDIETKWLPKFREMWADIKEKVGPALSDLKKTFDEEVIPAIDRFWTKAGPIWEKVVHVLTVVIPWALEFMVRAFDGALTILAGTLDFFSGLFTGDWSQMWEGLRTVLEGIMKIIAGIFGLSLDELKEIFFGWAAGLIISWTLFWQDIGRRFSEFGENTKKEWNAITGWVSTTWGEFTSWLSESWTTFWSDIGRRFSEFGTRIKDDWNGFWNGVGQRWDEFQLWLTEGWTRFWTWVGTFFSEQTAALIAGAIQTVGELDQAWRDVANIFRNPINWVINEVLNKGVLDGWNAVMGWIGAPGLQVKKIPELPMFAKGGEVPHTAGSVPNRDSVPIMTMPGEYVFSKRAIANMGGLGAVDQMHQAARMGMTAPLAGMREGQTAQALMSRIPMDGLNFAYGGVAPHVAAAGDEIVRLFGPMPGGIGGVGQRANASDHPTGHALDFMTMNNFALGDRVADHLYANAQRMQLKYEIFKQRIRNPGGGWEGMENRGSVTANHFDHVHASFLGGPGGGGEGSTAQTVSWWSVIGSKVEALFNGLMNFGGMPGNGSPIGNAITNIPKGIIGKVVGALRDKLTNLMTTIFATNGTESGPSQDRATAQAEVRKVAADFGWDNGPEWASILQLVMKESSWDTKAVNKDSGAAGLFQKMPMHGPVEPDAAGQARWGLNYLKGRYQTPSNAMAFHNRNGWYDKGGMMLPGDTYARNETGHMERVLDPAQTDAFETLVGMLGDLTGANSPLAPDATGGLSNLPYAVAQLGSIMIEIRDLLERRGAGAQILVEDKSGNPTETARATVLGLRLS